MSSISVIAWPGSQNPYQRLLHAQLAEQGAAVVVLPELTGSHTLNVLALPLQLLAARAGGARILHLHWVYEFVPPWMTRSPLTLQLAEFWYRFVLLTCRVIGLRIVWTAHNVLPHERVFADDVAARALLLKRASGVVLHSQQTVTELAAQGLSLPAEVALAPHGPYEDWQIAPLTREQARAELGWPQQRPVVLFFGRVNRQKGADELAEAFTEEFGTEFGTELAADIGHALGGGADGDGDLRPHLVMAGRCTDDVLAHQLDRLARQSGGRIELDLRLLTDAELQRLVVAADVVAAPFRSVTTSGSVLFALSLGVPVIVPDVPVFADLDPQCCYRYRDGRAGLRDDLRRAVKSAPRPAGLTLHCQGAAREHTWETAAERTADLYRRVLRRRWWRA